MANVQEQAIVACVRCHTLQTYMRNLTSCVDSPCGFRSAMSKRAIISRGMQQKWRVYFSDDVANRFLPLLTKLGNHLFRGCRCSRAIPLVEKILTCVYRVASVVRAARRFALHGSWIHVRVEDAELVGDVLPDRERRAILPAQRIRPPCIQERLRVFDN